MTLETKITTSFEKEIISDNLNEDFTETANLSIASNNFASEVVVFYVTDESDNNKTLYMRKPVNEELATEIVLVDNSEQTEQHIINTILLKEQRIINISRIEHLPTYLSLSKEFLHDEPPRYEIVTGKPLKTQLVTSTPHIDTQSDTQGDISLIRLAIIDRNICFTRKPKKTEKKSYNHYTCFSFNYSYFSSCFR
ncbi:uncharacterized protein LOC136085718 isoform X1 [Hydra vulgaris]|uniref:Uncharacterized protein LOC136085718 isoform X1 n=1 Tax=Hydra vulgaris TaxID=6087 RepID=A0ABM4CMT2_HYDVU